jgi:hypothetical protein
MWRLAELFKISKKISGPIAYYLTIAFELQVILTLMLMPFFIWWGLPISIMSWLGNTIFLPFLWAFILCGCAALALDALNLHHTIMHTTLELITQMWMYLLESASPHWMYGLSMYLFIPSCLITGLFFYWCTFYKTKSWQRISITLLSLFFLFGTNYMILYIPLSTTISYKRKTCVLTLKNGTLMLVDHGLLNTLKYQTDFVEYKLLATCWRSFGTNKIAAIVSSNTTAAHKLAHEIFYFTGNKPQVIYSPDRAASPAADALPKTENSVSQPNTSAK